MHKYDIYYKKTYLFSKMSAATLVEYQDYMNKMMPAFNGEIIVKVGDNA